MDCGDVMPVIPQPAGIGKVGRVHIWSQPILPAVFDDSLSYVEQLYKFLHKLNELIELYNSITENYITREEFEKSQDAQTKELLDAIDDAITGLQEKINTELKDEVSRLEKLIKDISAGDILIYDPTHGEEWRHVSTVTKRIYEIDRVFGMPCNDFDGYVTAREFDKAEMKARDYDAAASVILFNVKGV